jgi:uncharacterized glyoxalase superfamily protein PhnB
METTVAKLSRIAPELPVPDLRASIEYYVERLGFDLAVQMEGYAILERDGVAIRLFADAERQHSAVAIHIFTADLDELFRELEAREAEIVQPIQTKPWGNREFRVVDPGGNQLKFTEPLAE